MTNDYLLQKKPLSALLIFSLPIIIGNMFQQTYTMADSAIAGRFVGERALAAIGASYSLTNIFICIAIGGAIGASVIISQYFGARSFVNLGKSKIPLAFLIFSSVLNIILDWISVTTLHMGIAGVAWATLIAQGISALLSFWVLRILLKTFAVKEKTLFAREELSPMSKIALPSILQQSTVSIGMMLVQSVVNSFGSEILAGFSAAMRIESMCVVPMIGIGNALSSYTAQNIGAGQKERIIQGYHATNLMVIVCAAIICVILEVFHGSIINLFLGESATVSAAATGNNYLMFMGWSFCLIGFKMAVDGLLRGAGDMTMFTVANLVNLIIRVSLAMVLAPRFGIAVVWYVVPIGWLANWIISFAQYKTGKWKLKPVINVQDS